MQSRQAAPTKRHVDSMPHIGAALTALATYFNRNVPSSTTELRDRAIILCAIDLLARCSDLARIQARHVVVDADQPWVTISVSNDKASTAQGPSAVDRPRPSHLLLCSDPQELCTVCAIKRYTGKRAQGGDLRRPFFQQVYKKNSTLAAMQASTVSGRISRIMEGSDFPAGAQPHGFRGAGASALKALGWTTNQIREAGRWDGEVSLQHSYLNSSLSAVPPVRPLLDAYSAHGATTSTMATEAESSSGRPRYVGAHLRRFIGLQFT